MACLLVQFFALASVLASVRNKAQLNSHVVNISNIKPRLDINGKIMDIHGAVV